MNEDAALVKRHFDALIAEAGERGIPADVVGRLALQRIVALWLETRTIDDIASELEFSVQGLDPDQDFEFMRP